MPIDLIVGTEQILSVEYVQIKRYIEEHRLLASGDRLLVAVSGGPDSVALLRSLCELRAEFDWYLEVAHLQHGIRGEDAKQDALFVSELARQLGLPFHLKEVNLPQLRAAARKGNLEALAREERYGFFAEVMRRRGLTKVATAHTRDDQAETVLMWFLRGSGMKGLGGMAPVQRMKLAGHEIVIVRPLLDTTKAELLAYLSKIGQRFRLDSTNRDTGLLRNWIRLELLPKIEERFDGRLSERLGQQAEMARDEDDLLGELARRKLETISTAGGLSRQRLLAEPLALQRRLLRRWIESTLGNLRGLDFVHIDELIRLIKDGPPHGRLAIPGGWELARHYDDLKLLRRSQGTKRRCYAYDFKPGTPLSIAEAGREIRSELILPPLDRLPVDSMEAVFDAAGLTEPLTVRNFRNGDYFQPLGMSGHKKIKDLFIERKLPLTERGILPLLLHGEEVLWVPGCGRAEGAKITPATASILRLKLVETNS